MNLAGQNVALLLTDDGRRVLALASVRTAESDMIAAIVEESEDMGLWIRVPRADQMHLVLVRWDYILTVDVLGERGRVVGIRQ